MLNEVKTLLGASAANFTDAQINLNIRMAISEIEAYCHRPVLDDEELEMAVIRIAAMKCGRLYTDGLDSQSYSGVSEHYIDGYPADIRAVLVRKRKLKTL